MNIENEPGAIRRAARLKHLCPIFLDNKTAYSLKVFDPATIIQSGEPLLPPTESKPHSEVSAGAFGYRARDTAVYAASLYQSPDPNLVIVLWIKVKLGTATADSLLTLRNTGESRVAVLSKAEVFGPQMVANAEFNPAFVKKNAHFTATLQNGRKQGFKITLSQEPHWFAVAFNFRLEETRTPKS